MRILYHLRTLGDGAEGIHIREMVSAFRGLGHDVRVTGVAPVDVNTRRPAMSRSRPTRATPRTSLRAGNRRMEYARVPKPAEDDS